MVALATIILGIFMVIEDALMWIAGKLGISLFIVIPFIILMIYYHRAIFTFIRTLIKSIIKI